MEEMETMMYKSCIFDLDGTLTDTLDSLTFSVNLTMKEMGLPEITRDQCRMFVGNGSRVLLEKALRAASEEAFERLPTCHTCPQQDDSAQCDSDNAGFTDKIGRASCRERVSSPV